MTTAVSRSTMTLVQESRPLVDGPWLNVGSGPASAEGWTHLDGSWQAKIAGHQWLSLVGRLLLKKEIGHWPQGVKYCDVRRGLGVAADSVAVVYSSHMVEHLHRDEALRFLTEVRRVLKPGGVVRIVVPDVRSHRRLVPRASARAGVDEEGGQQRPVDGHAPSSAKAGSRRSWPDRLAHGRRRDSRAQVDVQTPRGSRRCSERRASSDAVSRGFLESDIPSARLSGVEIAERVSNGAGVCVEARK